MRWMVVILAVLLSGCVVAPYGARYQGPPPLQSTTMAQVNAMAGAQQPVAYKVGFMEGCDSGYVSAGNNSFIFKKDVERFGKDDLYQQGWNDGFNRCASGEGVAAGSASVSTYYGWGYYPGPYYSGYYYPDYYYYPYYGYPYYSPGFSLWLGTYGHHDHYAYRDHYYYTPWYGGHKYKGGHRGGPYIGKHRGGGHKGGGHKGGGHKGGGHKGGGHKGLGGFIR